MTDITIDEIKDIAVSGRYGFSIDFIDIKSAITRLNVNVGDAEYLMQELEQYFYNETYGDLKTRMEDNIRELQEEIKTLREENADLKFGITPYKGEVI